MNKTESEQIAERVFNNAVERGLLRPPTGRHDLEFRYLLHEWGCIIRGETPMAALDWIRANES